MVGEESWEIPCAVRDKFAAGWRERVMREKCSFSGFENGGSCVLYQQVWGKESRLLY